MAEPNNETVESQELDYDQQPPTDIVAYNELRSCADLNRLHLARQLEIQPDFQRDVVWSTADQTRFIDSLIKQLPIPSMCFSLDAKTRRWKVIDGLQRMIAITNFLGDKVWKLSRVPDVDKRISGRENQEFLSGPLVELRERVENLTMPITVIRCDYSKSDHMEFLFTIFHRLNASGVRLNNQEIRNCIYSGPFNELLKSLDRETPLWQEIKAHIAGGTDRFKTVELILRFFALYERVSEYSGNLPRFLNQYMEAHREDLPAELAHLRSIFEESVGIVAKRMLPHLKEKMGYAAWESVLVGAARNVVHLKKLSDNEIQAAVARILAVPSLSAESLSKNLFRTEKVRARIAEATRALA